MNDIVSQLVVKLHQSIAEGRDALEATKFELLSEVARNQGRIQAYREVLDIIQELLGDEDN